jgi:hypothetical protein
MSRKITWPDGKDFAFTVFDDTDRSTLDNVKSVYALLQSCGLRTTKSVWPLWTPDGPNEVGSTCEDPEYLKWLMRLQESGFEIGYHMSTFQSSLRDESIRGVERFAELFGHYPNSMANHVGCLENIYAGTDRLSGVNRLFYRTWRKLRRKSSYFGHVESTKYFWGDICKDKIKYVRNFVFPQINTLRMCPIMPYHDSTRPYVNYWFSSTDGSMVSTFNKCLSERNQDRLEEEGGACIMYTHFAFGFQENGDVNNRFKFLMKRLSRKNGWFVPVSVLLDYLLDQNGGHIITGGERMRLEMKWLSRKILVGTT